MKVLEVIAKIIVILILGSLVVFSLAVMFPDNFMAIVNFIKGLIGV